jgi:tail collar domain
MNRALGRYNVLLVAFMCVTGAACAERRSPPVRYPDACGSHVECFTKSLVYLADAKKLLESAQQQAVGLVPPGTVVAFAGSQAPEGWMFCDGRPLDKNDLRYKRLFDAIGTSYGGDANPNFQIPDYRGLFLRGVDDGAKRDPDVGTRTAMGRNGTGNSGNSVGSYEGDQFASHSHATQGYHLEAKGGGGFDGAGFDTNSNRDHPMTHWYGTNGAGGAETRPKNVTVYYMIKL